MDQEIQGFVAGGTSITVTGLRAGVVITLGDRRAPGEAVLSIQQSQRLRRILSAAEKRAGAPA